MPPGERWVFIQRYHDAVFAGHLGVSQTVCRLLDRVYWPGLHEDVLSYLASCSVSMSPPGVHGPLSVGHQWDRVAMDMLDMSVTMERGNHYVLVIDGRFSIWTEACPMPNKTAVAVPADTFFQLIICHFGMLAVIHSDQGCKFENPLMQELCLLLGRHKTRTKPYHPASDGLVEQFNRTAHDLLPAVMMAYRSSVHESASAFSIPLDLR